MLTCISSSPETARSASMPVTLDGSRSEDSFNSFDTPLLSRNSPARAVSRSSIHQRHGASAGYLSAIGSRMISSTLNARQRRETCMNIRNGRRPQRTLWRLADDSSDEMSVTTVLGLDAPDSQQNTSYSPVYSQFINADIRHTAPAIVNTSRINVHVHRFK